MQITPAIKNDCIYIWLVNVIKTNQLTNIIKTDNNFCPEYGKIRVLMNCSWECKLVQSLWKTFWQYILNLNIHLLYESISIHRDMPERTECICTSKDITECSWPKYGNNINAHQQENRYIYYRIVIQWDTTQQQQKKHKILYHHTQQ